MELTSIWYFPITLASYAKLSVRRLQSWTEALESTSSIPSSSSCGVLKPLDLSISVAFSRRIWLFGRFFLIIGEKKTYKFGRAIWNGSEYWHSQFWQLMLAEALLGYNIESQNPCSVSAFGIAGIEQISYTRYEESGEDILKGQWRNIDGWDARNVNGRNIEARYTYSVSHCNWIFTFFFLFCSDCSSEL